MAYFREGVVEKASEPADGRQELLIKYDDGQTFKALAYPGFTPVLKKGDRAIVNITARKLNLGTGGYDFIVANLSQSHASLDSGGHIIKMPYTPLQTDVMSVEEQDSPYHNLFENELDLEGMPVIIGGLHSHLAPASAVVKFKGNFKVAYIMTDGAALPISFSKQVRELYGKTIDSTITTGNAFGGDFEAVNIYTALLTAKHIVQADICIVTMGPGIKGTGTRLGFSGVEQGWIIDAVNMLKGRPVYIPRINFSDKRRRHRGLSHHSITVLRLIANTHSTVALPEMDDEKNSLVFDQIGKTGLNKKHHIRVINARSTKKALGQVKYKPSTMGRKYDEEPHFFEAAGAASILAVELLEGKDG